MKSERRHALQTNELADSLGHQLDFSQPQWKWIVGGALALFAAIVLYLSIRHQQTVAAGRAWLPFIEAQSQAVTERDAAPLLKVANGGATQPVKLMSLQMAGDTELQAGLRIVFRNRSEADSHFTKAVESFQTVAEKANDAELKQMALISLATAHECLRDTKSANEAYDKAIAAAPKSVLAESATQRKARMAKEADFYAWFGAYKPVSPHSTTPLPGGSDFDLKKELENLKINVPEKEGGKPESDPATEKASPPKATGTDEKSPNGAAEKGAGSTPSKENATSPQPSNDEKAAENSKSKAEESAEKAGPSAAASGGEKSSAK